MFWIELRGINDAQMPMVRDVPLRFANPDDVVIARRGNFVSILFKTIDRERFEDCTPAFLTALYEAGIEAAPMEGGRAA